MCRQRGLDSTGTEAELLKRLNDAIAQPEATTGAAVMGKYASTAHAMDDSMQEGSEDSHESDSTNSQVDEADQNEQNWNDLVEEEEEAEEEGEGEVEGEVQYNAEDNYAEVGDCMIGTHWCMAFLLDVT
jgi:hypothetical protein